MTRVTEVLASLRVHGTARDVAGRLGCSLPAASAAICKLKKRGLLRRLLQDGIRNTYFLTLAGRAEAERIAKSRGAA